MKYLESIKSISFIKANAADVIKRVSEEKMSYIITQNGEAKAILQDLESYEAMKNSLVMITKF